MNGARAQGLLQNLRVLLRVCPEIQLIIAAVAAEGTFGRNFHIAPGNDLAVRKLLEHVGMVDAAGKDKGHCLAGKIFNNKIFHWALLGEISKGKELCPPT